MSSRRAESWLAPVVGRSHRVALLVTLAALLWVGAIAGVVGRGLVRRRHRLLHPGWLWLGVALVAEGVSYLGYVFAYRETVRAEGGAELETPKAAALVATGFGVFLAGGGFALDREALRRAGLREDEARARVLGLGALEYSILAPAALIASVAVVARGQPVDPSLTWPWIVGVPVGAALALTALAFRRRLAGPSGWRARIGHGLGRSDLVLRLAAHPAPPRLRVRRYGAVYWFGDIACLWAALHAFEAATPPAAQLLSATRRATRSPAAHSRSAAPGSSRRSSPSRSAGWGSRSPPPCSPSAPTARSTCGCR